MLTFVESEGLMDINQSRFRAGHSTQTALLNFTDDIRRGKDRQLLTAMVMFDMSKAFDFVCHVTLLRKLQSFGFLHRILKWLVSYLSGCSQSVKLGG